MKIASALTLTALTVATVPATAAYYGDPSEPLPPTDVQTSIEGRLAIPMNGSSCDPRVISANLKRLKAASVLDVKNLTVTRAQASGACYGLPCQSDLEEALDQHCAKAEKLARIVEVVEAK